MAHAEGPAGILVGREEERAGLWAALDNAMSGQGRLVLLAGEPGIGKTRLAEDLASHATGLGVPVLWGRCYEEEGAPPYWPWIQPLRTYIEQTDVDRLQVEIGRGAAIIGEIVPEILDKLPGVGTTLELTPEQARFRLFESVTNYLKKAAQPQALLLVLDDLQWADKPSLLLLQFLAQTLSDSRMLVVGTYRDVDLTRDHPLSDSLAQLSREAAFERHILRGLTHQESGHLVDVATGRQTPSNLVDSIYAQTEGNPFFIGEIVRLLAEQIRNETPPDPGPLGAPEELGFSELRIPEGVRGVIKQRLNRLSEQCNEAMTVASVIGRAFDFNLLNRLTQDIGEDDLLGVVDAALVAHVIEEHPGGGERYQFCHALVQQTLSEGLSASRRARLHARIGEALEDLYGTDDHSNAAELAHHYVQAESVLGPEKLVYYCRIAGERALAANAWEEALGHFQRALDSKNDRPMDEETAALLFGLGRAQGATGQVQEAWSNLGRAFDHYLQAGDVDRTVAVAEYPLFVVPGLVNITRLASQALTLVAPDSSEAGRLLSRYGMLLNQEKADFDGAKAAFDRALEIAERDQDTCLEMRTLANAADVDWYHMRWKDVVRSSDRSIALARACDDPHAEIWPHWLAGTALLVIGDSEMAATHGTAMLSLAERLRNLGFLTNSLVLNALVSHAKGHWDQARKFINRALEIAPNFFVILERRAILGFETGDLEQAEADKQSLLATMRNTSPGPTGEYAIPAYVIAAASHITGEDDRLDVAHTAAQTVLSSSSVTPMVAMVSKIGLALAAVRQADADASVEQYAFLKSHRGTMLPPGRVSVDRLSGLLARTMGRLDEAVDHFEDSAYFCRRAGYRPELAWTCFDHAGTLVQRDAPQDRVWALNLLDEAEGISAELGMKPLSKQAAALRDLIESQPTDAPKYPDGLTPREVEVLRLVAAGKSNPVIAAELFISLNTVTRHLGNAFSKIGSSNRAEAAVYTVQRGLL